MDNSKDSVQNEQFGDPKDTENMEEIKQDATNQEINTESTDNQEKKVEEPKPQEAANVPSGEPVKEDDSGNTSEEEKETIEEVDKPVQEKQEKTNEAEPGSIEESGVEEKATVKGETSDEQVKVESETSDEKDTDNSKSDKKPVIDNSKPAVDYSTLSKKELVEALKHHNESGKVYESKQDVDIIKSFFYKLHATEIDNLKDKFLTEGGKEEDFKPQPDPLEEELKKELQRYQQLKAEYSGKLEEIKQNHLAEKYKIIEEISTLVNNKESFNKTFNDFRDLQKRWRKIGPVPQANLKDLWERYNFEVEKFYDYIKLNKELRDLDFKKNFDEKIKLCEKAEELLVEPNVVNAFKTLQKFHEQWREIGPVPKENRTELWERFKEATSKINKKHHEYFENLKKEQKSNLEKKTVLCEKVEEISEKVYESPKEWDEKSKEIIELQADWKTIGFAPKKHNNKIYARFREACDKFFDNKREFYSQNKEEQQTNLQLKTELCLQAESLQDSSDWKRTTDELIQLQKKWKEIGPVPRKNSDEVWKRFRSACDKFFNRKSEYYNTIDDRYEENLKKKLEIIEKIEKYELTANVNENLKFLKECQRDWTEIGFVPYKEKDKIQERYRVALNKHFDNLKVDNDSKNSLKYKAKLEGISGKPKPFLKLKQEREKYVTKLRQLESDIALWENNIGFFAKSDSASEMIKDFENKITEGRERLEALENKIKLIDETMDKLD